MTHSRALLVVALSAALAACSSGTEVGGDLDPGTGGGSGPRLGERSGSPSVRSSRPTATRPVVRHTPAPARTTAAPPVRPSAAAQVYRVVIGSDTAASGQFSPRNAQVPVGYKVLWVNRDVSARSVVADDGTFRSPVIAPGRSWGFVVTRRATVNYHDGTRPYAVGTLQGY